MKKSINLFFIFTLALASFNAFSAVKIVECEDKEGNRSFQKTCPPGYTIVGEKKIATGSNSNKKTKKSDIRAVIYLIPDCDACDEVKEFLSTRNISITEKNVKDNLEVQNELNEIAGALKVPTTVIGEKILTGYNREEFRSAIEAEDSAKDTNTEPAQEPEPEDSAETETDENPETDSFDDTETDEDFDTESFDDTETDEDQDTDF